MEGKLGGISAKVKIELQLPPEVSGRTFRSFCLPERQFSRAQSNGLELRFLGELFSLPVMTTFNSFRHAHSHHGHTGRGALLRVQVRL